MQKRKILYNNAKNTVFTHACPPNYCKPLGYDASPLEDPDDNLYADPSEYTAVHHFRICKPNDTVACKEHFEDNSP